MTRYGLAMLGMLLIAGEAQAADQFDLLCKGEIKKGFGAKLEPFQQHYHIDLERARWCEGSCGNVWSITDVSPTRITLLRRDEPLKHESELHIVERTTGEWYHSIEDDGDTWTVEGRCEPAQFSGINPTTKF